MKKVLLGVFVLLLTVLLSGCGQGGGGSPEPDGRQQASEADETAIAALVGEFGRKLQMVSLQAPADVVSENMRENYGAYVSPELLAKWQGDPGHAPGRMVSSPWPDRIEIKSVEKEAADTYTVQGEIIEVTSVEKAGGGAAAKVPVVLQVKKTGDRWLIYDLAMTGADGGAGPVVYRNVQYGFDFSLPESWAGYTIVNGKWEGRKAGSEKVAESGPLVSIRHPAWTAENPRQDIPIMVFTLSQWESLRQGKFHIGAAPIGPKELGRNTAYVFGLPARYNFAFPTGFEEVEDILNSNPLHPVG